MKKDTRERFTLRLPTALFMKIQNNANEVGTSINALILQILWEWIRQQERKESNNRWTYREQ